ncbi:MAG: hypothetical protein ABR888_07855 [Thermoplasmata archaeon]
MADRPRASRRRPAPRRGSRHRAPARRRTRALSDRPRWDYVRLEIDLVKEAFRRRGPLFLHRLEAVFREQEVVEVEGLLRPAALVLHALGSRGFSRVNHWEVRPGGWLPLPEPAHERLVEPVGHLVHALRSDAWKRVGDARSFAVRLSGPGELRADVTVRRVHRERAHAITLELFGLLSERELHAIEQVLGDELTVARLRRTESVAVGPQGP